MKNRTEEMTPDEKFNAISNLHDKIETSFIELGQLFMEVKNSSIFKLSGHRTFKEFVEEEYSMTSSFASKLIGVYYLYIVELDIDEARLKNIGFDKLNLIRPIVNKCSMEEVVEWLKVAEEKSMQELRDKITEYKERLKLQSKTAKDIFIEQFIERMINGLNCNATNLNFKLALYFQDINMDEIVERVKQQEERYIKDIV